MGFGVPLWEDGFTEAGRWSRGPPDWGTVEGAAVGCCGAQSQQAAGAAGPPQGHRCAAASQPQLFSVPPGWGAHPHPCGEELRLCGGRSRPVLGSPPLSCRETQAPLLCCTLGESSHPRRIGVSSPMEPGPPTTARDLWEGEGRRGWLRPSEPGANGSHKRQVPHSQGHPSPAGSPLAAAATGRGTLFTEALGSGRQGLQGQVGDPREVRKDRTHQVGAFCPGQASGKLKG